DAARWSADVKVALQQRHKLAGGERAKRETRDHTGSPAKQSPADERGDRRENLFCAQVSDDPEERQRGRRAVQMHPALHGEIQAQQLALENFRSDLREDPREGQTCNGEERQQPLVESSTRPRPTLYELQ